MPKPPTPTPVPKPPTPTPRVLPIIVARQLASLAGVPVDKRKLFYEYFSESFGQIWQRDRRAVSSKPGPALVRAAKAATTLQKEFYGMNKEDRGWVDHIISSSKAFLGGKKIPLGGTIIQLALVFNHAIGRRSPTQLPRRWRLRFQQKVKDQMLRELVFSLLSAAYEVRGEFTLDKNQQRGTLLKALHILRPHLPKGLVPNVLPVGTIQKLKTEFSRLERL